MNTEEIINIINKCKKSISKSNINEAIDCMKKLKDLLHTGDEKSQSILLLENLNKIVTDEIKGINNESCNRNAVIDRVLTFLNNTENSIIKSLRIPEFKEVNLSKTFKEILDKSNRLEELSPDDAESLYLQNLKLRQEMFSEVDKKLKKDYPKIMFSRIFFAHTLEQEEINQLLSIPTNDSYSWHEKSIIVSALSLSLIKEFNKEKVQLLINFITPFEEKVWQRALTGLAIGLHNKAHILKLFPKLETQLNKLQEISEISKGLQTIAIELNNEHYNGCFRVWHEIIGEDSFRVLRTVDSWFIPYYKNNPVINDVKARFPDIKDIHLLPDLILSDRHLSNSQKYVLALNLEHYDKIKVNRILNRLKRMSKCTREHIFDPYIADFYWFYKSFPTLELDDIFKNKIELYKSKLIEVLINEDKVDIFRGVVEFRNFNIPLAIKLLKGKEIDDKSIGLDLREQGYFNYLIFEYDNSILKFQEKLKDETDKLKIGFLHSNLSLLYILKKDEELAKKHVDGAIANNEYAYSAKNLGYYHILKNNESAAFSSFQTSIRNFGSFDNFMFEINQDSEHIISVINKDTLDKLLKKVSNKN